MLTHLGAIFLGSDSNLSVAVIEAGGFYETDAGNFSQIPADENIFTNSPVSIDWKITTSLQPVCFNSYLTPKDGTFDIREATRRKIDIVSTRKMPRRIVSPKTSPNTLIAYTVIRSGRNGMAYQRSEDR